DGELAVAAQFGNGQTDTVDGDRVAERGIAGDRRPADRQSRSVGQLILGGNGPALFDDSGEHADSSPASCRAAGRAESRGQGARAPTVTFETSPRFSHIRTMTVGSGITPDLLSPSW